MTIRVDDGVERRARELFAALGMDMATAVNVFLRQALDYGGIPFTVRLRGAGEAPNAETAEAIDEADRDEELCGPFDSVDEMMEALNA